MASLKVGRNFNVVALASVIVAISQINGPLLQRASRVAVVAATSDVTVSLGIAPQLPLGYTGLVEGRANTPSWFTAAFLPTVNNYYDRAGINVSQSGCTGICSTTVSGAGFAIACTSYNTTFDAVQVGAFPNASNPLDGLGITVFQSNFGWYSAAPGNMTLSVEYKSDPGCRTNITVNSCTLSSATVRYNVLIDGNASTISLNSNSSIYDEVESNHGLNESYADGSSTTLGGIVLALQNRYNSGAAIRFGGGEGYEIDTNGSAANQFVQPNSIIIDSGDCSLAFIDPTTNLLENARELMFRTAIAAANSSNVQSVPAQQKATIAVYESHYLYLGLASLFTALAIILVVPTFIGYWHLGRKVSMSPIETAKAFNAPLLRNHDSNADADQLVKNLGQISVRYGAIVFPSGNGELLETKQGASQSVGDLSGRRLEMAPPEYVLEPRKGWQFGG